MSLLNSRFILPAPIVLTPCWVLLALTTLLAPVVADAQTLSDCENTASLCMAGCAATGTIGDLLGGRGTNAAQQCRVLCSERQRECERQYRSTAPAQAPSAESAERGAPITSRDRDCVKQWSSRVDPRGQISYFFVRNNCSGPVTLAMAKRGAGQTFTCYPEVLRRGAENEFTMSVSAICLHAASISPDQAASAQDVNCQCPAGATFIPPYIFNAPPGGGTAR